MLRTLLLFPFLFVYVSASTKCEQIVLANQDPSEKCLPTCKNCPATKKPTSTTIEPLSIAVKLSRYGKYFPAINNEKDCFTTVEIEVSKFWNVADPLKVQIDPANPRNRGEYICSVLGSGFCGYLTAKAIFEIKNATTFRRIGRELGQIIKVDCVSKTFITTTTTTTTTPNPNSITPTINTNTNLASSETNPTNAVTTSGISTTAKTSTTKHL